MNSTANIPLAVTGLAARTAVGADAAQTCAAIRAGVNGYREHPYMHEMLEHPEWKDDVLITCAPVPGEDLFLDGPERLTPLLRSVVHEIVDSAALKRKDGHNAALLLALPELDEAVGRWGLESFGEVFGDPRGGGGAPPSRWGRSGLPAMLPRSIVETFKHAASSTW